MKFCMDHWGRLKKAISERGLDHLIAEDGKSAADAVARQIKGEDDKSDFDPLMSATFAIYSAYIRDVGLSAMMADKDGSEVCPLCGVANNPRSRKGLDQNWIDGAAADSLEYARHIGLIPARS